LSISVQHAEEGGIRPIYLAGLAIVLLVAWTYLPILHAGFVWDDVVDFEKSAWLQHGDDWLHFLSRGFNSWSNYFRPLVVALFTLEVRAFGQQPGPMHAVSLIVHLFNTCLVGLIAYRISNPRLPLRKRQYAFAISAALYGVHPLLVESVAWIGCQFDLAATMFMLIGWLCGIGIQRPWLRALCVASAFFLAACAKESAIAFPVILVLFDWFLLDATADKNFHTTISNLLKRHRATYVYTLAAGIAYLALRHVALGNLLPSGGGDALPAWARLQEISFLYLRYWRMFFWPTLGMGPIHIVPSSLFLTVTPLSVLTDFLAIALFTTGIWLTLRRSPLGLLILSVTIALFPVLHILASNLKFDASLYHERYATTALAMLCVWLPLVLLALPIRIGRIAPILGCTILVVWTALAVLNVRLTAPLWSSNLKLWQWALEVNPGSVEVKDELISTYIDLGENAKAWQIIHEIVAEHAACTNCLLNAANLAVHEGNIAQAEAFLDSVKDSPELHANPMMYRFYLTTQSQLMLLQNNPVASEQAARQAIAMDELDPNPQLALAIALAFQGKTEQATSVEATALGLLAPDAREQRKKSFEQLMTSLAHTTK
jgi:protein O-mannosyl-transferase